MHSHTAPFTLFCHLWKRRTKSCPCPSRNIAGQSCNTPRPGFRLAASTRCIHGSAAGSRQRHPVPPHRIEQRRIASTRSRVTITLSEPHSISSGVHRGIGTICSSRGACPHLLYRSKSRMSLTPTYTTQITQPRHRPSDTAGKRDRHPKATKLASTPPPRMPADRAIMRCWRLWRKLLKFCPSVASSGSRMPICGYESYHEHFYFL